MKGGYKVLIYPVHNVFRAGKLSYSYDLCLDDMKFNGDKEKKAIHTDIKRIRNGTDNKCAIRYVDTADSYEMSVAFLYKDYVYTDSNIENRRTLKRIRYVGPVCLIPGIKIKLGADNCETI